jgi:hypothetical protein
MLRTIPASKKPVSFDDVMDALRTLDEQMRQATAPSRPTNRRRKCAFFRDDPSSADDGFGVPV